MTTNEQYPDRRDDDTDDSREIDPQESRIQRAWDALEQLHDRVAELTPEASEQDIATQIGEYVADALIHDADRAAADDRVTPEVAALPRDDSTEVLLQGGVEDDLSIPLDGNPVTHVATEGHDELLADAATAISREDVEFGTETAILLGRAKENVDRTKLNIPPRPEQSHPDDAEVMPPAHEAAPVDEIQAYLDRLDVEYKQRLAELFASGLQNLSAEEIAFIHGDEELRNQVAYAIQGFGIDQGSLDYGRYHIEPFRPGNSQILMRAMDLERRAMQVNDVFQDQAHAIAQATGSLHLPGPIKDARRIAEKMEKDYGDGQDHPDINLLASKVKDAVRCRIVINGDPTVADQAVIDQIEGSRLIIAEDSHHHPLIKRSFRDRYTGEPIDIESSTSYRDTKVTVTITVEVRTRDGEATLCEIAIVTPEMAVATVAEHPIYEITRSLQGDKRPIAARLDARLKEIQNVFYGDVSLQIANRLADSPS
ncbi:MAG: hypothetical protein QM753_00870 [Thermomicrobiales bacterium]